MWRNRIAIVFIALVLSSSGLYAKKKAPPKPGQPSVPQMTADRKVLHALNRLTFGPRPGDLEAVNQKGLDAWIEQQLHPRSIAENPVLEAKLAPLDTLQMSTAEL